MTSAIEKDSSADIIKSVVYLLFIVLFFETILVSWFSLYAGGGAEEAINVLKVNAYFPIAIASVVVLLSIKLTKKAAINDKATRWFDAFVHDPEKSIFSGVKDIPMIKFFYRTSSKIWLLWLFSILIFLPFAGLGGFIQQTSVEGGFAQTFFPQTAFPGSDFFTEQQVTETADVGLSVYPASTSETLLEIAYIAVLLILAGYLAYEKGFGTVFLGFMKWFVIPILGALGHMIQHFLRYGGSDVSLFATFNFGIITAYLYLMFASAVIPLVYHEITNLMFKLFNAGYVGSDASIAVVFFVWFVLLAIFIFSYQRIYSKKESKYKIVKA